MAMAEKFNTGQEVCLQIPSARGVMIGAATDRLGRKHDTIGEEHTMKLLYFDDFKLGVLKNDAVVDVSAAVKDIPHTGPGDLMNGLIERWGSYKPRLEAAAARGAEAPVSSVRIRPPVPGPRTIGDAKTSWLNGNALAEPISDLMMKNWRRLLPPTN